MTCGDWRLLIAQSHRVRSEGVHCDPVTPFLAPRSLGGARPAGLASIPQACETICAEIHGALLPGSPRTPKYGLRSSG